MAENASDDPKAIENNQGDRASFRDIPYASGRDRLRHTFVRDLVLPCSIGVHRHEWDAPQRVRINIDLAVAEEDGLVADSLENVVCYQDVVEQVREVASGPHVNLVETLAEQIAKVCLGDKRVRIARIRVEKLDVFADTSSVGVEIERFNNVLRDEPQPGE